MCHKKYDKDLICIYKVINPTSADSVICQVYYLHLGNFFLQPCNGILETGSLTAHAVLHVSHLAQQRLVLQGNKKVRRGNKGYSRMKATKRQHETINTHSSLEGVDLTGVGLDLVPVLHALLLGLTQCIIVLIHSLVQVRHLRREVDEILTVQRLKN